MAIADRLKRSDVYGMLNEWHDDELALWLVFLSAPPTKADKMIDPDEWLNDVQNSFASHD